MKPLARFKNSRMSSLWKGSIGIVAEGMRYLAALTGVLPSWETSALFLWMNPYIKAGPHRSALLRLLCSICGIAELPVQGYGRITECAVRGSFHTAPCYRNSQERVLASSSNSWKQEQSECECAKPCSSCNGPFRWTQGVGMMWRRDDTFWLFRKAGFFFVAGGGGVWQCLTACGILVPRPGIEPKPPALKEWSLNHWTTKEIPERQLFR